MGGKEGGGPITIGYHYFMSMHLVICQGPVDKIRMITTSDDLIISSSDIVKPADSALVSKDIEKSMLYGGPKKEGGIQGRILILFGDKEQLPSEILKDLMAGSIIHKVSEGGTSRYTGYNQFNQIAIGVAGSADVSTTFVKNYVPAFRGVTSVVWDNMLYQSNSSRPRGWKFKVERTPYPSLPYAKITQNVKAVIDPMSTLNGVVLKKLSYSTSNGFSRKSYGGGDVNDTDWVWDCTLFGQVITPAFNEGRDAWLTKATKKMYAFYMNGFAFIYFPGVGVTGVGGVGNGVVTTDTRPGYYRGGVTSTNAAGDNVVGWGRLDTGLSDEDDTVLTAALLDAPSKHLLASEDSTTLYNSLSTSAGVNGDNIIAANPAYILLECLTNAVWGLGFQLGTDAEVSAGTALSGSGGEFIDLNSFTSAAKVLGQADSTTNPKGEGFGLSAIWQNESSVEDFMTSILTAINGVVFLHPNSGKFTLKLLRADDQSELTVNEDNIIEVRNFARSGVSELVNQLSLVWTDPILGGPKSLTVHNSAARALQGHTVAITKTYSAITDDNLAMQVAVRDLGLFSQAIAGVDLVLNRTAANLTIGSVINWSWADYGITNMSLRVSSLSFGLVGDGRITAKCVENVYAINKTQYGGASAIDFPVPAEIKPEYPTRVRVFNLSYLDLFRLRNRPDLNVIPALMETDTTSGVIAVFAKAPNRFSNQFLLKTSNRSDSGFVESGSLHFTPFALNMGSISKSQTTFALDEASNLHLLTASSEDSTHYYYSTPSLCMYLVCCDGDKTELMELISLTKDYKIAVVTRGVGNTVPKPFPAQSELWFYSQNLDLFTLQREYPEYGNVFVKTLTEVNRMTYPDTPEETTAKGIPSPTVYSTTVKSWALPYPVANLTTQVSGGDVMINWAHRDAALLQDKLVGQTGTMERTNGIFYAIEIRNEAGLLLEHDHRWIGEPVACHYVYHPQAGNDNIYVGVKAVEGDLQSEWNIAELSISGLGTFPNVPPIFPEITPITFQQHLDVGLDLSLVNSVLGTTGLHELTGNDMQLRIKVQVKDKYLSKNEKNNFFRRYRIEIINPVDDTIIGTHYSSAIDSLFLYSADLNQTDHGALSSIVTFRVFVEDTRGIDNQGSIIIGKALGIQSVNAEEFFTGLMYDTIADIPVNTPIDTIVYITSDKALHVHK